MSVSLAEQSTLSGVRTLREAIGYVNQNIANATNENHHKIRVDQEHRIMNGRGYGVNNTVPTRQVDSFLLKKLHAINTDVGYADTLKHYNDRIQLLLGVPGTSDTLNAVIDDFFSSLSLLANNPENLALRNNTVIKAQFLADKISYMAQEIQRLRYEVDQEVANLVNRVNNDLDKIHSTMNVLGEIIANKTDSTALEDERDLALKNLSSELGIKYTFRENGEIIIVNSEGMPLLDKSYYQLEYKGTLGLNEFLLDTPIKPLQINKYGKDGNIIHTEELISGGREGEITSRVSTGKLGALHDLRDVELVQMLEQLDNLAVMIRDEVNAIHNNGSGLPAASEFTSNISFVPNSKRRFTGETVIAAVDKSGSALTRADGTPLKPLILDFDKIEDGDGKGLVSMQTIMDEINQYYFVEPIENRLSLGDLYDIKIASKSSDITADGTFSFDFQLNSNSNQKVTFSVTGIEVYDNTNTLVPGALVSPLPDSYVIEPGMRTRTDQQIDLDFGAGAGGPYTIRANIGVIHQSGEVYTTTSTFVIDDTPANPDIMNRRYTASAVVMGQGKLINSNTVQRFMKAEFVDENGSTIPSDRSGYMQFKTESDNYSIAFADRGSKELGFSDGAGVNIEGTNRSFLHYFGFNNLFYDTNKTRGSAYNFSLEQEVKDNPARLSVGGLYQQSPYESTDYVGIEKAKGTIQFNGVPDIGDELIIQGVTFRFVAAATADDEITIGGNIQQTLENVVAKLNSENSTTALTVDQASYTYDSTNTLIITHNVAGTAGNNFTIGINFATTTAIINGGAILNTQSRSLQGGANQLQTVTVTPFAYEVSIGSQNVMRELHDLARTSLEFMQAGGMTSMTATFSSYAGSIIEFRAFKATMANIDQKNQKLLYTEFETKLRETAGIDVDEQLLKLTELSNAYNACATALTVTNKLYDRLFEAIKR